MKKFVVGTVSALALLGLAACSDTDDTTTQSVPPAVDSQPVPMEPAPDAMAPAPETDNTTTQSIDPTPDTGTGGETQLNEEPSAMEPPPAQ